MLSQVTSAGLCERNWSTFDFIHSKKRNKLTYAAVRNIVKVHCNLRLVDNIEMIGHSDANIDWSSSDEDLDWLAVLNFYELYFKIFELHNYAWYVWYRVFDCYISSRRSVQACAVHSW